MFLSELLQETHSHIYKEEAQYNLIALPRMEIQSIEDLKILFEIGVLQPDHAVKLSEVLLGATGTTQKKRKRSDDQFIT